MLRPVLISCVLMFATAICPEYPRGVSQLDYDQVSQDWFLISRSKSVRKLGGKCDNLTLSPLADVDNGLRAVEFSDTRLEYTITYPDYDLVYYGVLRAGDDVLGASSVVSLDYDTYLVYFYCLNELIVDEGRKTPAATIYSRENTLNATVLVELKNLVADLGVDVSKMQDLNRTSC